MYDPVTARFLQEDDPSYEDTNDPISLNLYTYCHNEPIMYNDPTGHNDVMQQLWLIQIDQKEKSKEAIQNEIKSYNSLIDYTKIAYSKTIITKNEYLSIVATANTNISELSYAEEHPGMTQLNNVGNFVQDLLSNNLCGETVETGKDDFTQTGLDKMFNNKKNMAIITASISTKKISKEVKKEPIKENEITTYKDFNDRSIPGDNLEGHELWQHANIKANGLVNERLSTEASKGNPVISVTKENHKILNKAQRAIDAANQTPLENVEANAKILLDKGTSKELVDVILTKAKEHILKFIK